MGSRCFGLPVLGPAQRTNKGAHRLTMSHEKQRTCQNMTDDTDGDEKGRLSQGDIAKSRCFIVSTRETGASGLMILFTSKPNKIVEMARGGAL